MHFYGIHVSSYTTPILIDCIHIHLYTTSPVVGDSLGYCSLSNRSGDVLLSPVIKSNDSAFRHNCMCYACTSVYQHFCAAVKILWCTQSHYHGFPLHSFHWKLLLDTCVGLGNILLHCIFPGPYTHFWSIGGFSKGLGDRRQRAKMITMTTSSQLACKGRNQCIRMSRLRKLKALPIEGHCLQKHSCTIAQPVPYSVRQHEWVVPIFEFRGMAHGVMHAMVTSWL